MTTLAERRALRAQQARTQCPDCGAAVEWYTTSTGARTLLEAEPVDVVLWSDLQAAGAERGIEDRERVRGYHLGRRTVPGLRVSPAALPGVPRTAVRAEHLGSCPARRDSLPADHWSDHE